VLPDVKENTIEPILRSVITLGTLVNTDMSTAVTIVSLTGAMAIRLFVMVRENMPEMKTATASVRYMSIKLRVSGRVYVPGFGHIVVYPNKTYPFI